MATVRLIAIVIGLGFSVVACHAESRAEPVNFPDLAKYAPVNAQDYTIALPNPGRAPDKEVFFLTPDEVPCALLSDSAGCKGDHLPGVQDKDKNPYTYISTDTGLQPATSSAYSNGAIQGHQIKTLPPLHSITVSGVICGVDDAHTTACKDAQGRGFVLSPRGSTWLPHV
jgi:hypothetical protein